MKQQQALGAKHWVDKIGKHELPALAATVKVLEKIAQDDTSSLALLGQSVLHDHGLTTRILRVVNSVVYRRGKTQVTTVSRAAVVLGYDRLKHICITARMIDSMLSHKNISEEVYQLVLKQMARSLHAAMLAKAMLQDYSEETQEEVYIATLLHNLGEVGFWTLGAETANNLAAQIKQHPDEQEELIFQTLGCDFNKISVGLATSWNMGPMLIKSLESPDLRSPELRCIQLAHHYSEAMVEGISSQCQQRLQDIAKLMTRPLAEVKELVQKCTEDTYHLAGSYGASALKPYLEVGEAGDNVELVSVDEPPEIPKQALQLQLLGELTLMTTEKTDINMLIHTAMEGIQRGVGMDKVLILMVSPKHNQLIPRFVMSPELDRDKMEFQLPLSNDSSIFNRVFHDLKYYWVDKQSRVKFESLLNPMIRRITDNLPFFVAPLTKDGRCIAMMFAARNSKAPALSEADFDSFSLFVRQTDLCLSVALRQK